MYSVVKLVFNNYNALGSGNATVWQQNCVFVLKINDIPFRVINLSASGGLTGNFNCEYYIIDLRAVVVIIFMLWVQ